MTEARAILLTITTWILGLVAGFSLALLLTR